MKRILALVSVVALMMVMVAMSVAPAFAYKPYYTCTRSSDGYIFVISQARFAHLYERTGFADCVLTHVTN